MNEVCEKAYTEILEIIKYLPSDEYNRIPREKIEFYKMNCDPYYEFEYNPLKSLNDQNILRETKILIVMLFRDVVANKMQKEKLDIVLNQNEQQYQEKLNQKYNSDALFKKKKNIEIENEKDEKEENEEKYQNNTQMVIYKENLIKRLLRKIKDILIGNK